jgi:hypothetical protein
MNHNDLLEEDLVKFAAKHYYSPKGKIDPEEFYNDLKRFKYVKRLVNRYLETGNLPERLILNHTIVIFNVFGSYGALRILGLKLEKKHWEVIKPFLEYLNYVRPNQLNDIESVSDVVDRLKRI